MRNAGRVSRFRGPLAFVAALAVAGCGQVAVDPAAAGEPPADAASDATTRGSDATTKPDTTTGGNTAPIVSIKSPANDAVFSPGQTISFTAKIFDDSDSPDLIKVQWKTETGTVLNEGKVGASGFSEFDTANITDGAHKITCFATDTAGAVGTAEITLLINSPPGAPGIEILPATPTTTDDLVCNIVTPASDPNRSSKELTYSYAWFKNDVATKETGKVLPNALTSKGEKWTVKVKAKDPKVEGPETQASVTIGNALPVAPALAISPTAVDLLSDVSCATIQPAIDPDGDKLSYEWSWTINQYTNPGATTQTINIKELLAGPKLAVKAGDQLKCAVIVKDDAGPALPKVESAPVNIQAFDICNSAFSPCDDVASCQNTNTLDAICTCPVGYFGDGKVCFDTDECLAGDKCSGNAECSNTPGSFKCVCKPGFLGDGATCTDIDECSKPVNACDLSSQCSNTAGSYACKCAAGYGKIDSPQGLLKCGQALCPDAVATCNADASCKTVLACVTACTTSACFGQCGTATPSTVWDAVGKCAQAAGCGTTFGFGCNDVDECTAGTAGCDPNATCSNSVGGSTCTCKLGYEGDGKTCADTDECQKDNGGCSANATCQNFEGGRFCICKAGYVGSGEVCTDVDECATPATNKCDANADCKNTPASFECSCKAGYSGDGKNCADIDECATGVLKCHSQGVCLNSQGSAKCECKPGYTGDGKIACDDVDQCATGALKCGTGAVCLNQAGPDTCKCDAGKGYTTGDPYIACYKASDPCVQNNGGCAADAICTVAFATAQCKCKPGFLGDGKTGSGTTGCTDIKECTDGSAGCSPSATCTELPGSYKCACKAGYSGDGKTCTDNNECAANNGGCSPYAACTNLPGSFSCKCLAGYSGDGKTCGDVNECLSSNGGCSLDAVCTNTPGGVTCGCKPGFTGDGKTCADIDECKVTTTCDGNATCTNSPGSFKCVCKAGWQGDGKTCSDVDECATANGGCVANAACTNAPGTFSCACKPGFAGDPKVGCADIDECPQPQWTWDFAKQGFAGWALSPPSVAGTTVGWKNLNGVLYYGNDAGTNFDTPGATNKGTAMGPSVTLAPTAYHVLQFDLNMVTEGGAGLDKLIVYLVIGGTPVQVWDKAKFNNAMGTTQTIYVPLAGYAGKTVQAQFSFDTVDPIGNSGMGVKIFNVKVSPQNGACDYQAVCANTTGSYTCKCGYGLVGDGKKCGAPGSSADFAVDSCQQLQQLAQSSQPGMYWIKQASGAPVLKYCEYGWTRLSLDNFEAGLNGSWQPPTTTTCGSWTTILGGYGVTGAGASFALALSGLPAHSQMRLTGTYIAIDSWEGEQAQVKLDDALVWQVQYKATATGGASVCGQASWPETQFGIQAVGLHNKPDAKFVITSTLDQGATDEAFGADNLAVWYQ